MKVLFVTNNVLLSYPTAFYSSIPKLYLVFCGINKNHSFNFKIMIALSMSIILEYHYFKIIQQD